MKYKFTGETRIVSGVTLRRIRAVINFGFVNAGSPGGWIESEKNLSQHGDAWVDGDACVYGDAFVSNNAQVYDHAMVYGFAHISGDACVSGNARVHGSALVYGNARVLENAEVCDNATVNGEASVFGNARVSFYARLCAGCVCGDARVGGFGSYLCVGPIGSRSSHLTVTLDEKIKVRYTTGCFSGSLKELRAAVLMSHGKTGVCAKQYAAAIAMAKVCVK